MFASKDTLLTRPSGGYTIARSVRLRSSASAYFNRTFSTPTSASKWTKSFWIKRGVLGAVPILSSQTVSASANYALQFNSDNTFTWQFSNTLYLLTTQVFRDPSAWYHFVLVWDSANATAANRAIIYVNGVQVTSYSNDNRSSVSATQNAWDTAGSATISYSNGTNSFDGYLTEVNFIDGQALTPSSFGSTNAITGVWQPAKYTGTYGTNGFYLNFSDNSNNTATTIGKDYSGNGNNWTPNNISVTAGVTYDSMTDVPTLTSATAANYAVINPVFKSASQPTISNGNLTVSANVATYQNAFSTIGSTSGKQYCEITITGAPNSANMWGVANAAQLNSMTTAVEILGSSALSGTGYGYYYDGRKYSAGTLSSYGSAVSSGDVMGIALDLDNGKVWFSLNGTWQASGDPAAGTNAAFTGIVASGTWFFGATAQSGGSTAYNYNFGQRPFSYTPPTGFVALNTYNLPASTITNGAAYMAATIFDGVTGGGSVVNTVNGIGFQPDMVWMKTRNTANNHEIGDSVRGTPYGLFPNLTNAEVSDTRVSSFNSNGFGYGTNSNSAITGRTVVGWQWKAGGTSSSNTNGSITSTVSVGATQGFSVVTYTSTTGTVGHGLGVAPSMIIMKPRNNTDQWTVGHVGLPSWSYGLSLNSTSAQDLNTAFWNGTAPTSTVFSQGSWNNTYTKVAYCFSAVAGYSAFGSYTGNGSADGTFVYTGFRPRFVMMKKTDNIGDWWLYDTSRSASNTANLVLYADTSAAEISDSNVDILSNGFKLRSATYQPNNSGGTYIYMAFAENPFRNSLAR